MVRRSIATGLGLLLALGLAAAVRAQSPAPIQGMPVPVRPSPTAAQFPLGTDTLMEPVPAVPPRTSYQPDRTGQPINPARTPNGGLNLTLPDGFQIPVPDSATRLFRFIPRYGKFINVGTELLPDQVTRRFVVTGGLIVNVSYGNGQQEIEFATDEAVVWVRGNDKENAMNGIQTTNDGKTEVELYLAGNVVIRTQSGNGRLGNVTQTLRAEQVYYDVNRSRAVALCADLELNVPRVPDGVHLQGKEIDRLDADHWEIYGGSAFSSKLPSDPGLRIDSPKVLLEERHGVRKNIFGKPYRDAITGEPVIGTDRIITAQNMVTRLNGLPVFYLPKLKTNANEPFGPLVGLGLGQSRIFGTQINTSWDMYKLLALRPPDGHNWRLHLDYLSDRGPAAGTDYTYRLPANPGQLSPGQGQFHLFGINDNGVDVLGGDRGPQVVPPVLRGRADWRHVQALDDIVEGLYFQGQVAYVSDMNFLEQYYNNEWNLGPNHETFGYLTWNHRNFELTGLVNPRLARPWISQTAWLPRVDAHLIGQSFFDRLVYNARANAGYAQTHTSGNYVTTVLPTDRNLNLGRVDLGQELSLPFELGPVKLAPYGKLDLAYYSSDLEGNDAGRVLGGGGLRTSLPLSRLYEEASSELFNIRGLYHKTVLGANYYYAQSNIPYTQLPLVDRLNDDAVDQAYRTIRPYEPLYLPGGPGLALATSELYDPQKYIIRRLVENRIDTLDSMNVLQMDVRQRFQTKRGYPGLEHTVDAFTLGLSGSWFPQAGRDNFGKPFAFLEYNALWNVGDRTSLLSNGWFDPYNGGTRYWNIGTFLNRTDRTNFYLGYRQTDPLNSKQVTAAVGYQLSRRYYMNLGASYDFGIQEALSNTFTISRTGSDMTVSIGITYNALINNLGFQFLVIPNIAAYAAPGRFGATALGR